ncbi:MAG: A/G-specific adenine glycosylase [Rhodospirillaceae bacterium]|nr:A/G-specific adenine glycosylase [Rhodospirillaceae bacterium]|tara:strand:- start:1879 stop:2967 length:1089 start_codon:yes stop_codon:yes gene_type:complete
MTDNKKIYEFKVTKLRKRLLHWYDSNGRSMPWRVRSNICPNPYHVWVSEIMLQQTTVNTVIPYFIRFTKKWPTVFALAQAPLDDVLCGWQGLGYYARARNLHRCAKMIVEEYNGVFPREIELLKKLPGIGDYTSAAINSIAFGKPANVVDGNVERVIARFFSVKEPLPGVKSTLKNLAFGLAPKTVAGRPGDYAQALMDLGATICTPRKPKCSACPLLKYCMGARDGLASVLPIKKKREKKPWRKGTAFWISSTDGKILLRKRPDSGLLGGMMEFPSTPWSDEPGSPTPINAGLPISDIPHTLPGTVRHVFTHFRLELNVAHLRLKKNIHCDKIVWCAPDHLSMYALPSVMKKIAHHATNNL